MMIQIIGLMIGAYIFTRMVDLALDQDKNIAVVILAVITAFVAVLGMAALILNGMPVPQVQ
jgi:hypothetical protein